MPRHDGVSSMKPGPYLTRRVVRWLFILEGGITILAAFFAMFILPDYPAT